MLLCFELVSNVTPFLTNLKCSATGIGEGFQKQKWKFKMAFAMKGEREGSRAIKVFRKMILKKHLESFSDCQNLFYTLFGLYIREALKNVLLGIIPKPADHPPS